MRVSLLIGLVLIAVGLVALYQVKNGFLMSNIAKAYYAPPAEPEALRAAFDELGNRGAAEKGYLLKQVAEAINRAVGRASDMVSRYGGEEFVAVLGDTPLEGGLQIEDSPQAGERSGELLRLLLPAP